jgi:EAL domain-containing protein (putative c-di-GMP-specific phosphodiesterase class I)
LYGSEFGLLFNSDNAQLINQSATLLSEKVTELAKRYELEDLLHIGIVRFERSNDFRQLQPAMVEAYEQAKNIGQNAFFINEQIVSTMNELEWKQLILDSIEAQSPEITLTSEAYDFDDLMRKKVMSEAFTVVKDSVGETLSIGTFFSMAQEFRLEEALDKVIVGNIIQFMEAEKVSSPVTINLSMTAVTSPQFQTWLQSKLTASSLPNHLFTFSVTAYSAAKDLKAFSKFCDFIKSVGAQSLLKRYSSDIIPIDMLKDLNIDYVRLARDLTSDIRGNASKAEFLELIHEVTSLLEIKLLAEGVTDDNDIAILKSVGIYGVSR